MTIESRLRQLEQRLRPALRGIRIVHLDGAAAAPTEEPGVATIAVRHVPAGNGRQQPPEAVPNDPPALETPQSASYAVAFDELDEEGAEIVSALAAAEEAWTPEEEDELQGLIRMWQGGAIGR